MSLHHFLSIYCVRPYIDLVNAASCRRSVCNRMHRPAKLSLPQLSHTKPCFTIISTTRTNGNTKYFTTFLCGVVFSVLCVFLLLLFFSFNVSDAFISILLLFSGPKQNDRFLFFVSHPIHFSRRQVREKTSPNKNSLFLLLYFNVAFYGIFLQLFSIAISTHAMPLYYMLEAQRKENEYRKCSVCCVSGSVWLSHRLTAMMLSSLEQCLDIYICIDPYMLLDTWNRVY